MNRLRVLLVGHSYLADENRKGLDHLAEECDVRVASPSSWRGQIFCYGLKRGRIEGRGWRIELYPKLQLPGLPQAAYFLRTPTLGMRSFEPHVVHVEADPFSPVFLQSWACSRFWAPGSRLVCTVKQNTYTSRGRMLDLAKDSVGRVLNTTVRRFITVNRGVERIYRERFGVPRARMVPITHLGVDTRNFAPGPEGNGAVGGRFEQLRSGAPLVGYVGRLIDYKGVPDLVRAVEGVRRETGLDVRLALLGDGPLRAELTERSRESRWITVEDPVPHAEVASFLRCLDLFVMPSRVLPEHVEHDAHALLEAMATGVACIGARGGAVLEVLAGAGELVPPADVGALANAVAALLRSPGRRAVLGRLGRKRVEESFSLGAVASRCLSVYRSVVEPPHPGSAKPCPVKP